MLVMGLVLKSQRKVRQGCAKDAKEERGSHRATEPQRNRKDLHAEGAELRGRDSLGERPIQGLARVARRSFWIDVTTGFASSHGSAYLRGLRVKSFSAALCLCVNPSFFLRPSRNLRVLCAEPSASLTRP